MTMDVMDKHMGESISSVDLTAAQIDGLCDIISGTISTIWKMDEELVGQTTYWYNIYKALDPQRAQEDWSDALGIDLLEDQ